MNRYDIAKNVVDFFRGFLPAGETVGSAEEPCQRLPMIVSYHYVHGSQNGFGSFMHWARKDVDAGTLLDELGAACISDCQVQCGIQRASCDIIAVSPLPVPEVEDGGE